MINTAGSAAFSAAFRQIFVNTPALARMPDPYPESRFHAADEFAVLVSRVEHDETETTLLPIFF